jgi:NAD(P)H-nitrite reductase large subunit
VVAHSEHGYDHVRLYIDDHQIKGALIMGNQTLSRPLHQLIERQADVSELRSRLITPDAPVPDLIFNFWQNLFKQHANSFA